jgi:hypothetical protein
MTYKTPFKAREEFENEIRTFLNYYGTAISREVENIPTLFEITCYNYVIEYYVNQGYILIPRNPAQSDNYFIYKTSPSGNLVNYSFFEARKQIQTEKGTMEISFVIRQNVPVQSGRDTDVYYTPDIVICKDQYDKIKDPAYYRATRWRHYLKNENLISFAEAKHYNPFPEILVSFIGLIHELNPNLLKKKGEKSGSHLAPSLMFSGRGGAPVDRIKKYYEKRYSMNIFLGLVFNAGSIRNPSKMKKINKIPI